MTDYLHSFKQWFTVTHKHKWYKQRGSSTYDFVYIENEQKTYLVTPKNTYTKQYFCLHHSQKKVDWSDKRLYISYSQLELNNRQSAVTSNVSSHKSEQLQIVDNLVQLIFTFYASSQLHAKSRHSIELTPMVCVSYTFVRLHNASENPTSLTRTEHRSAPCVFYCQGW